MTNEDKSIIQTIIESVGGMFSGIGSNVVDQVTSAVTRSEEKLIKKFTSAMIFIAGIVFVSIALVTLITQYLKLNSGWSFVIIGLILIIWSLVLKSNEVK